MKAFSKISIFSLLGVIMNGWLAYLFLSLWLYPQASDIELIYSLTILILFEFILVHSGVFMSVLGRSWIGWLFFIFIYGIFAFAYNTFISGNQIIILYGAVVLNRMLQGILSRRGADKEQGLMMAAIYAITWFGLLIMVVVGSSYIPRYGLTEVFVNSTNYTTINQAGGDFKGDPHIFMCFGVLYYLILMFVEVNTEIQRVKNSLLPATDSVQTDNEKEEIKDEQSRPAISFQFENVDGQKNMRYGCSPWLVYVLAATFIAIGIYQQIDYNGILFVLLGIIIIVIWKGLIFSGKNIENKIDLTRK